MKLSKKLADTYAKAKENAAWAKDVVAKKISDEKRELMECERIRMMINIALVDGTFSDNEKSIILSVIEQAPVSNKAKMTLNAEVANPKLKELNLLLFKADKEYAKSLIHSMAEIMNLDGASKAEKDYVNSVATKLGIKLVLKTATPTNEKVSNLDESEECDKFEKKVMMKPIDLGETAATNKKTVVVKKDNDEYMKSLKTIDSWDELIEGFMWMFKYTADGEDKSIRVDVIDDDSDEPYLIVSSEDETLEDIPQDYERIEAEIKSSMLDECFDYEDIGMLIANLVISDNDDKVNMSCYGVYSSNECYCKDIELDKNFKRVISNEESQYLILYSKGLKYYTFETYCFNDDAKADEIKDLLDTGDDDSLSDMLVDCDETCEFLNLWDDEEIEFELQSKDGKTIKQGSMPIFGNIALGHKNRLPTDENCPKYMLWHKDEIKKASVCFEVPANTKPENIHFILSNRPDSYTDWDVLGDSTICMNSIVVNGKVLNSDVENNGTYGANAYVLYQLIDLKRKNGEKYYRYEEMGSLGE